MTCGSGATTEPLRERRRNRLGLKNSGGDFAAALLYLTELAALPHLRILMVSQAAIPAITTQLIRDTITAMPRMNR